MELALSMFMTACFAVGAFILIPLTIVFLAYSIFVIFVGTGGIVAVFIGLVGGTFLRLRFEVNKAFNFGRSKVLARGVDD